MIIVFEGIDNSGKSTQINNLTNYLTLKGIKTKVIREFDNPLLTNIQNNYSKEEIQNRYKEITHLIYGVRYSILHQLKDYINEGYVIIYDRFITSTYVYNTNDDILWKNIINGINDDILTNYKDIIFFFLNINEQTYISRKGKETDGMEEMITINFNKYKDLYIEWFDQLEQFGYVENYNHKPLVIDGNKQEHVITEQITSTVNTILNII